jgi:hypothetical protein
MPPILVLPAVALVVAAVAAWRLERRLRAELVSVGDSRRRLALLRRAVATLDLQTGETQRRHGDLASP